MFCSICHSDPHLHRCPARKRSGRVIPRTIRSFDCETTDRGIVLFLSSDARRNISFLYNANGLAIEDILTWLTTQPVGTLNFGFFFDYDVNQIIALLPDLHKAQLAASGKVLFRQFRFRHIPGKRFSITNTLTAKTLTIWDCAGWAQTSFARLCEEWKLGTAEERAEIKKMKARRGEFETATKEELVSYTTLECSLLSIWCEKLLKLHEECGITLRAYSGPGSTASALYRAQKWIPPEIPPHIESIAEQAFFGGRSEISCIGPVPGPIHSYDINSAYPYEISKLPQLHKTRWFHLRKYRPELWGFWRVRWHQPKNACWGYFPLRGAKLPTGRKSVSLLYSNQGEGWFHSEEIRVAYNHEPNSLTILEGYVTENEARPFAWVQDLARQRLEYKAAKDLRAVPLKFGLNSLYGKLAQHTGTHPLQCITYAAAITAGTRAQLLSHALQQQHEIILLATDGILSTCELKVPISPNLGDWEHRIYPDAWILQAGVYWCGDKIRTRGIDGRSLEKETIHKLWQKRKTRAELILSIRRVLSYKLCAAQNKLPLTGKWISQARHVRFTPEPRRRSYRWLADRLLTLPARISDYQAQALLDMITLASADETTYDGIDAMPDWILDV